MPVTQTQQLKAEYIFLRPYVIIALSLNLLRTAEFMKQTRPSFLRRNKTKI